MEGIIVPPQVEASLNPFETLSTQEEPPIIAKETKEHAHSSTFEEDITQILPSHIGSPIRGSYSPSYVDMLRNKPL